MQTRDPAEDLERLGGAGGGRWAWLHPDTTSTPARHLPRAARPLGAVSVHAVPAAVARPLTGRDAASRGWPLPLPAIRAWAGAHPGWALDGEVLTPVHQLSGAPLRTDKLIADRIRRTGAQTRTEFLAYLEGVGSPGPPRPLTWRPPRSCAETKVGCI